MPQAVQQAASGAASWVWSQARLRIHHRLSTPTGKEYQVLGHQCLRASIAQREDVLLVLLWYSSAVSRRGPLLFGSAPFAFNVSVSLPVLESLIGVRHAYLLSLLNHMTQLI